MLAPPLAKDAPLRKRLVRTVWRLGHGLYLHDALLAAPAMAFHFFLSLLPLLAFAGYVVGLIARRRGIDAVLAPLLDNLPSAAEKVVKEEVVRLAGGGASALGPVAAISFLWIASGGIHGLMDAIENVVGAPARAWWKKRLVAAAWVLASLIVVATSAFALVEWDALAHAPEQQVRSPSGTPSSASVSRVHVPSIPRVPTLEGPVNSHPRIETARRRRLRIVRSTGERLLALSLSVLMTTATLAAFYRVSIGRAGQSVHRVLPGAVIAVIFWLVVSWLFGFYVSTLADYAAFYGSLAAVAVLLVWLWLTSLAILIGAEFNAQLEGRRD